MRQRLQPASTERERIIRSENVRFREMLSRCMNGVITPGDWVFLNDCSVTLRNDRATFCRRSNDSEASVAHLCATKASMHECNHRLLQHHASTKQVPLVRIDAIGTRAGTKDGISGDKLRTKLEPRLWLAKGAPVVCSWNGWQRGYC